MELQSSLEFLGTYSWIAIIIFIIAISILVIYLVTNYNSSYNYCNINSQIQCINSTIFVNSSYTKISLLNKNNIGATIYFSNNSIELIPNYVNSTYYGECTPKKVNINDLFTCNVLVKGNIPLEGSQFTSKFNIFYSFCSDCSNNTKLYPTTGSIVSTVKYS
ncbi:MAG: hypothetical protein QXD23_02035 [Candidatus Micrarchaeaceae archaeon]